MRASPTSAELMTIPMLECGRPSWIEAHAFDRTGMRLVSPPLWTGTGWEDKTTRSTIRLSAYLAGTLVPVHMFGYATQDSSTAWSTSVPTEFGRNFVPGTVTSQRVVLAPSIGLNSSWAAMPTVDGSGPFPRFLVPVMPPCDQNGHTIEIALSVQECPMHHDAAKCSLGITRKMLLGQRPVAGPVPLDDRAIAVPFMQAPVVHASSAKPVMLDIDKLVTISIRPTLPIARMENGTVKLNSTRAVSPSSGLRYRVLESLCHASSMQDAQSQCKMVTNKFNLTSEVVIVLEHELELPTSNNVHPDVTI